MYNYRCIVRLNREWVGGEPCVINLMNLYFLCPRTKSSFCATWPRRRLTVFGIITKWNIFPLLPNKFYFPAVAPSFCGCCVCVCAIDSIANIFVCFVWTFPGPTYTPDSANGCCESHWAGHWACSAGRKKKTGHVRQPQNVPLFPTSSRGLLNLGNPKKCTRAQSSTLIGCNKMI